MVRARGRARCPEVGVFLELFSGHAVIAKSLRALGFAVVAFDIQKGAHFDLCNDHVLAVVREWIELGLVWGMWFGTPCVSWSIACKPAVRSRQHIWGLPSLSHLGPHRVRSLKLGNRTLRISCSLIRLGLAHQLAMVLENPDTSMMFHAPPMLQLARRCACQQTRFCMCAFGARWRKPTRLLAWNVSLPSLDQCMCTSHKQCQFSGKSHIVLSGTDKVSKRSWTSIAGQYPRKLGSACARDLALAAHSLLDPLLVEIIGPRNR